MDQQQLNTSYIAGPQQITFVYESPLILYKIYQKIVQIDKQYEIFAQNYIPVEPPSDYTSKKESTWLYIDPEEKQSFKLLKNNQDITIQKLTTVNMINLPKQPFNQFLKKRELRKIIDGFRYQEIFRSQIQSLEIVRIKIEHNQYFSIEEFIADIKKLFNKRLALFFQPEQLIITNFSLFKCSFTQLELFWNFYSQILADYWEKLLFFMTKEALDKKYFNKRNQDLKRLFGEFSQLRCIGGCTKKVNEHFKKKIQTNKHDNKQQDCQDYIDLIQNNTISLDISMKTTNFYDHFEQQKQKLPLSQEYPLINNYKPEPQNRTHAISRMMQSGIKPKDNCNKDCECISGDSPCPNMLSKIQCAHHNCRNSQIKNKKQVFCRYLGIKNRKKAIQNLTFKKDFNEYEVQQYHSFGLDFYTVRILYYLLPYAQRIGIQALPNQTKKQKFISMIIPQHVTKKQSLIQAVEALQYDDQWGYYARILHKKLRIIEPMALQNLMCKYQNISQPYPNVTYMEAYYKGIGVRNTGKTIPKGQFIQKFVGQILQPWRQYEKQTIVSKISKQGYKNQKPEHIKFYCMSIQSHINQPYGITTFSVDPQNKGNFTRSLNHSCNPNCSVQVFVSEGMYHAAVFALRPIQTNQELTFDYMSITDNYEQYSSASCLCGKVLCTGKYLRYHQILYNTFNQDFMRRKYPIEERFTDLLYVMSTESNFDKIKQYLIQNNLNCAFSDKSQNFWLIKWAKNAVDLMNYQLKHQQKQDVRQLSRTNFTMFVSQLQENSVSKNFTQHHQKTTLFYEMLRKERLVSISTKISKVLNYLQASKDYSSPIQICSKQHVLFFLKSNFQSNCSLSVEQFLKLRMKIKKINMGDFIKNSQKYRLCLVRRARDYFKKGKLQDASIHLSVAFTFLITKIHLYPSFKSQPVVIWRQNADPIKESLQYKGTDYMILNQLLNWGDIKKQSYFAQKHKNKPVNIKSSINEFYSENHTFQNQILSQQELSSYLKYLCKKADQNLIGFTKKPQIERPKMLKVELFDVLQEEIRKINEKSRNVWLRIEASENIDLN